MKFIREQQSAVTIRRVERGCISVGDNRFERSVAITDDSVIGEMTPPPVDRITVDDLEPLLGSQPEVLLIGTGWQPGRPPRELLFAMARRGVGLEIMDTPAACRTFNILAAEGRRIAALLVID